MQKNGLALIIITKFVVIKLQDVVLRGWGLRVTGNSRCELVQTFGREC